MTESKEARDDALQAALRAAFPEPPDDGFTISVMRRVPARKTTALRAATEDDLGWLAAAATLVIVPVMLALTTNIDTVTTGSALAAVKTQALELISLQQPLLLAAALTACTLLAPLALEE